MENSDQRQGPIQFFPVGSHPTGEAGNVSERAGTATGFLRIFGEVISYLFHPLFIPGYITAFLLYIHPLAFAGETDIRKHLKLISVVLSTALLPSFTVFLLRQLGFVQSIQLRTQKERIIPIVASMVYYFWIFYVSRKLPDNPPELVQMLCAVFISSIISLTANNFIKVSLHGIAMGVLTGFFIHLAWVSIVPVGVALSISILVAGLVTSARMMVSDHTVRELIWGLGIGLVSMFISVWVAMPE
ncbi:hypothetical protein [Flavihumibacter solisilvae]|jgi:hypothetical protein|uniref:hypothetical protein n=1 Tax=Flavihumibacter solisilvae TaxID=1349421 RepID=UPI00068A9AFF|nr:hypothetical protein [Flavihumibacter solisilvae]